VPLSSRPVSEGKRISGRLCALRKSEVQARRALRKIQRKSQQGGPDSKAETLTYRPRTVHIRLTDFDDGRRVSPETNRSPNETCAGWSGSRDGTASVSCSRSSLPRRQNRRRIAKAGEALEKVAEIASIFLAFFPCQSDPCDDRSIQRPKETLNMATRIHRKADHQSCEGHVLHQPQEDCGFPECFRLCPRYIAGLLSIAKGA
jgi:hypothetical protein